MTGSVDSQTIENAVIHEILGVMRLQSSRWARILIKWIFHRSAQRLAEILTEFDSNIAYYGWATAAQQFLNHLIQDYNVHGLKTIPSEGPLLAISNHPGAYDVLLITASLPRDDVKIISSQIGMIPYLPHISSHFIQITADPHQRMTAIRAGLEHLRSGKALLIFPRGEVEVDPALGVGAQNSLQDWSPSIEFLVRRVPECQTLITLVRGVLAFDWFQNPVARLWRSPAQRQKIAEIFQVAEQLLLSKKPNIRPEVWFSNPISFPAEERKGAPEGELLATMTQVAELQLAAWASPATTPG